ncbi:MAG TPA: T9SS type A sorting domain-containing protein [Saprospiraceae bacterium]|nr:T9SS type A sorting domain-containing protein [Saprospiraceae bacterium]HMQ82748.1 T9SS type A sorting domain-containing protein [Saprospiraceae bacterium]
MKNLLFLTGIAMPLLQANSQVLFEASPEADCVPGEIHFSNIINDAASYEWDFGNGQTSDDAIPTPHVYEQPGVYDIQLTVTPQPGQRLLYEMLIEEIPGGWWEIFEGQVDLYVKIYDSQNQLIYTSIPVYEDNVPTVLALPCLVFDQIYFMEIYDYDLLGNEDFLGTVLIDGGLPEGTVSQPNLILTYYTEEAASQYVYTSSVSIEQPAIEALEDQLTVHVSFLNNESILDHYEWYWDGNLIPDSDTATITAPGTGTYTVYVDRTGCEGWSYPFVYVADTTTTGGNDSLNLCDQTIIVGLQDADTLSVAQIRKMPNGDLLAAGQWNGRASIVRSSLQLDISDTLFYDPIIGGISELKDVQQLPNGNWLAVGSCRYCAVSDTLSKVFLMQLDANLQYLDNPGIVFIGEVESYPTLSGKQEHPRILLRGDTIVLVTEATTTQALNFTDLLMTKLSTDLEVLSQHLINNTGFDLPLAIYHNEAGYAVLVNHAFIGIGITQTDDSGNALWFTSDLQMQVRQSVQLPNGLYLLAGSKDGADYITILSDADGSQVGLEGSLGALEASAISLLENGELLAAIAVAPPAPSIQIHRFRLDNVFLFDTLLAEVPNQSYFFAQVARSLVSLNEDGTNFALGGRYAFFGVPDRIFLHTTLDCPISAIAPITDSLILQAYKAYPNPFTDRLSLVFYSNFHTLDLRLFNSQGQMLVQDVVAGKEQMEWANLGDLPPGVYYVQAVADGKMLNTCKVIHQ